MKNLSDLRLALQSNGYVMIPHQNTKDEIRNLFRVWKKFLAEPLSVKQKLIITKEGGYEYKGFEERDYKENFHLSLSYLYNSKNSFNQSELNFLVKGATFLRKNIKLIAYAAKLICGDSFTDEYLYSCAESAILRFIYYPPQNREVIAFPHVDKGITMHFAEDASGFQIFWNDEWKYVDVEDGYIIVYSGLLGQLYSRCRFPALCHRVVNSDSVKEKGRNSIVLFFDPGQLIYDKKRCGPTQKRFPKGENYKILFSEFKTLFIKKDIDVL